jgi:PHD/YefM family antitoxin component YafN of YafNO toxin-antitoxin module
VTLSRVAGEDVARIWYNSNRLIAITVCKRCEKLMKTQTLKETATHYVVEIDQMADSEPTLLESNGRPVAVLISAAEYDAFRDWLVTRQTTAAPTEFDQEVAAFERLKPTLQKQHAGRAVAIHQSQVVAVGDDKMSVLAEVLARFGPVPCYIEWVAPETPRRVRISSAWVAR